MQKERMPNQLNSQSHRRGFTMVELLMVIGLILFLLATTAVIVKNIGNTSREKATMATVTKINGLLTERIEAMRKALDSPRNKSQIDRLINQKYTALRPNSVLGSKANAISRPVMEILVKKDLFRQNFPQMGGESPGIDAVMGAAAGRITGSSDGGLSNSAEYLYHVITAHDVYGISPVGEDAFSVSEIDDTDGDGLKEFVDGWGKPLRFYRWPTRLIKQDGLAHSPGSTLKETYRTVARVLISSLPPAPPSGRNEIDPVYVDSDDPQNRIIHDSERLGDLLDPLFNTTTGFPSPYAFPEYASISTYSLPLIISPGADGQLGLYEPFDTARNGVLCQPWNDSDTATDIPAAPRLEYLFDSITNHNQRAGGR